MQAAAERASSSLGDARRELRDFADGDNVSDGDARRLREQVNAVADIQELTDVLATTRLSTPRIEAAFARSRQAIEDLSVDIDVPKINADVLAADLRKTRSTSAAAEKSKAHDQAQTGQPSQPVGSSGGSAPSFGYFNYVGPAFQARLPTGSGWGSPSGSEPTPNRLFRTNVRGPDGLFVIIDYTPFEPASFGTGYTSRTVVGQTAFGAAIRYEFQGGRIAECKATRCVDYIINDASTGSGFAVLAGGGPGSAAVAETVAQSVVPTSGG